MCTRHLQIMACMGEPNGSGPQPAIQQTRPHPGHYSFLSLGISDGWSAWRQVRIIFSSRAFKWNSQGRVVMTLNCKAWSSLANRPALCLKASCSILLVQHLEPSCCERVDVSWPCKLQVQEEQVPDLAWQGSSNQLCTWQGQLETGRSGPAGCRPPRLRKSRRPLSG